MYGKLFNSMYDGTLATTGPWEALVTFQQLLILADKEGLVDMTPEAIARRTTIPLEIIVKGLEALEKPDPQSRTPDEEGRRLLRLCDSRPWGWRIVNYNHYRAIRSSDDRREYMKMYQRQYRKKSKPSANTRKQNQPMAEAKVEAVSRSTVLNKEEKKTVVAVNSGDKGELDPKKLAILGSLTVTKELREWEKKMHLQIFLNTELERFKRYHLGHSLKKFIGDPLELFKIWCLNSLDPRLGKYYEKDRLPRQVVI